MSMSFSPRSLAERLRARGRSRPGRLNRLVQRPRLEGLEVRIAPATDVWTGVAAQTLQDLSWSNASNWSSGAPQNGQDLVFPASSSSSFIPSQPIVNDLTGMTFVSIEIDAPGYSITGDGITLTAPTGITATYGSGVSTLSMNVDLAGGNVSVATGGEFDIDGVVSGNAGLALTGGGILGGNGQIPALTVEAGELSPGIQGVGGLTVLGSAALYSTSTFAVSINGSGGNSMLTVPGRTTPNVALDSPNLDVSLAPGFTPATGSTFTIINGNAGGTFNGLQQGAGVSVGGTTFAISYRQGVVLTAVQPSSVQTTVLNGTSPSVFGQSVTFVATVTSAAGQPTGSVTFDDGTTVLGTVALNASGVATFTAPQLAVGQHAITAIYGGDADLSGSTSPVLEQMVNQADTLTTVSSSTSSSDFGERVTFTAQVAAVPPGSGTLTGSVVFFDGATDVGSSAVTAGVANFSTSALALGSHSISAVYSGDANFLTSTSAAVNENVNQASTHTNVTSSSNPSAFGQSVILTARVSPVSPGGGTPTGSVDFFDGATELGSISLTAGVANFSTSALALGSHSITAVYSGDANFNVSTSTAVSQSVDQAHTNTSLVLAPAASALGQTVTFTAQVTTVPTGSVPPTGSVDFFDGQTMLANVALTAGSASFTTSALTLGSHSITAAYAGDGADFLASTSTQSLEVVGGTTVALASSANPSTFGQSITFTATVAAAAGGSSAPTGSVSFMDGAQVLGTATLDASGVTTISTAGLSGGTTAITAVYAGNTDFAGSTSSVVSDVVNQASSSTTLGLSASQSTFGQNVVLTATVSGTAIPPTGSVTFKDGSTVLGTSPLNASGVATFSASALAVGAHSLVASYTGSGSYASSSSSKLAFTVGQAATTTILTGSTVTPGVGQNVTFTATVAAVAPGAGSPTGMVAFHDGSGLIGTVPVSAGQASLTVAFSGLGQSHAIEAAYLGSEGDMASGSAGQTVTVVRATPITTLIATPIFAGLTARGVAFQVVVQAGNTGAPVPTGKVSFRISSDTPSAPAPCWMVQHPWPSPERPRWAGRFSSVTSGIRTTRPRYPTALPSGQSSSDPALPIVDSFRRNVPSYCAFPGLPPVNDSENLGLSEE